MPRHLLMPKSPRSAADFPWRVRRDRMIIVPSLYEMESIMVVEPNANKPSMSVNERILAKAIRADYRRVEAASVKIRTQFLSAEVKRMFARFFAQLQLHAYFISVIARTRLPAEEIEKAEARLREQCESVNRKLDRALDAAELQFQQHGIVAPATYDNEPLTLDVAVMSSLGRRYLELLGKLDLIMPLLQTLEILEVLSTRQVDVERAILKREVRGVAFTARSLATGFRRRVREATGSPADTQDDSVDSTLQPLAEIEVTPDIEGFVVAITRPEIKVARTHNETSALPCSLAANGHLGEA